jgi:hypothetical protein
MPGEVLALWRADRETLGSSFYLWAGGIEYGGCSRGSREGTPMQELRFVAVSEDGSYAVVAVPGRSARFILPIDERLRAVALGQTSRLAQYEIEVESPLRPKEIQARIRAGETAEEIADAAGIPVERVRWFEGPVLAERAYIAQQAQTASVRRAGESAGPGPRLGEIVPERLSAAGADPDDGQWDSRKRGDGSWQVQLTFSSGGRLHIAEWVFDPRRRHAVPDDDNAARLSLPETDLPPLPASMPGEATVTPLAPRLGAVSAGGGAGSGAFGSRFRPDRPAAPPVLPRSPHRDPVAEPPTAVPHAPAVSPAAFHDPERSGVTPPRLPVPDREPTAVPQSATPGVHVPTARPAPSPVTPERDAAAERAAAERIAAEQAAAERAAAERAAAERIAAERAAAEQAAAERAAAERAAAERAAERIAAERAAAERAIAERAPAARMAPQPESAHAEPVAAEPEQPAADAGEEPTPEKAQPAASAEQGTRPRGGKKNARGRRSSVPSWDEIMLGSSRQRD